MNTENETQEKLSETQTDSQSEINIEQIAEQAKTSFLELSAKE